AHPLMRSLWRPRLVEALKWIDGEIARLRELEGRTVVASEAKGEMVFKGARIHGRADRIDTIDGGKLAVVDYKTGMPPSRSMVKQGFSLQLGLIGMIAARGGFDGVAGEPAEFEYWSLAKDPGRRDENGFGYVASPFRTNRADGVEKEEFLDVTEAYLADAIDRWITGSDPFTARLNPDIGGYNDYDQLMRLDEWLPHMTAEEADEA
ncbi:MAG: PD-(D/E)XK nuclease family protein, partial [Novosphingobium sp.]|nr:PD-(D/E)XK nuclease family protein [Novosphingobium sp.]